MWAESPLCISPPHTQRQNLHTIPLPGSSTLKDPPPGRSPLFLKNSSIKAESPLISSPWLGVRAPSVLDVLNILLQLTTW